MFQESADNVRNRLKEMVKQAEALLGDKTDESLIQMKRDYRSILGNDDAGQEDQVLPREQRLARREVMKIIDGVEKAFTEIAGFKMSHQGEEEDSKDALSQMDDETGAAPADIVIEDHPSVKLEADSIPSNHLVGEGVPGSAGSKSETEESGDDQTTDIKSDDGSESE